MPPSDLAQDIDAMARDFAAMMSSGRDPSDQRSGMAEEGSGLSARLLQAVEATVREAPRLSSLTDLFDRRIGTAREEPGFAAGLQAEETLSVGKTDQYASDRPWISRLKSRTLAGFFMATLSKVTTSLKGLRSESPLKKLDFSFRTVASFFIAALIGVGAIFAWQSYGVSMTTSPAAEPTSSALAGPVSTQNQAPQSAALTQSEPLLAAAASSLRVAQQFETITRDLAILRDNIQQLAAKQEQNTQNIATLEAMAAKEESTTQNVTTLQAIVEMQEQMARDIATLQAADQDIRQKFSSPSLTQAVPLPRPRKGPVVALKQSADQSGSFHPPAPVRLPFLEASP